MNLAVILILGAIGLGSGLIIYLANAKVPHKVQGTEKIEEINRILPGLNCGACGYAGCFSYAQELARNAITATEAPCTVVIQNPEALGCLEKSLNINLDASIINKKALIRCRGRSPVIFNYSGVKSCRAAAQLVGGYKQCPYACLGFGDCTKVCPQDAISIDSEKGVAAVDFNKCTGCGLCVAGCPQNLIELVPAGTKIAFRCNYQPLKDIPGREKCQYGCTHCLKCFKACTDEAIIWNKDKAIPEFDIEKCTLCGKCIEECPQCTLELFTEARAEARPATHRC